ncbi:hypothetical protein [Raoultella ornithinolytica]|nr:hypothetical protein [Raoultella ornithinolytica]CAE6359083.1 hypothetical protein AI2711V1_3119 [Raoultella ornithinolytica]CAH3583693.1 hypothetical protein AI2711V1_3119 [Raoultella ornithinolytica]
MPDVYEHPESASRNEAAQRCVYRIMIASIAQAAEKNAEHPPAIAFCRS